MAFIGMIVTATKALTAAIETVGAVIASAAMTKSFILSVLAAGGIGATTLYIYEAKRIEDAFPSAEVILVSIEDTAKLVTHKRTYQISVETGILAGFRGANSFSGGYRGTGEIHAGIDLSKMTHGDIERIGHGYKITLPPATFTTCVVSEYMRVRSSTTLFSVDWGQLDHLATVDAYISLVSQGLQSDLLSAAQTEAESYIEGLIRGLSKDVVEIEFVDVSGNRPAGADPRCIPRIPAGWAKEDGGNNWLRLP